MRWSVTLTRSLLVGALALAVGGTGPAHGARTAVEPAEAVSVVAAHVHVDNYRNYRFTGFWSLPGGAEAVLCYSPGGTPTSPDGAQACSDPDDYLGGLVGVAPRSSIDPPEPLEHFAVFARSGPTAPWGPPALDQGGSLPPFPPAALQTIGISASALTLSWEDASPTYGSAYQGRGGTTRWVIAWARGDQLPEALAPNDVTTTSVSAGEHSARVDGLEPGRDYTFQARGRDADGHLSDWSDPVTAMARRPGLLLVHGGLSAHHWGQTWVPRTRWVETGSAAVGPWRRVHVVSSIGAVERYHVLRGGSWTVRQAPSGDEGLTSSPAGVLAAARTNCISVKRPGRPWKHAWCANDLANISGPVLDNRSKVHAFVETPSGVSYVTNWSGRWRAHRLTTRMLPTLVYDAAADRLVAVQPDEGDQSAVLVSSKRPAADRFRHRWTWKLGPDAWGFGVVALAGRLTVVVGDPRGLVVGTASTDGRRHAVRVVRPAQTFGGTALVATQSQRSVALAWTARRGVMTGLLRLSDGRWDLVGVRHRTGLRYDTALDLDVGPDGRAVVLVARAAGDVPPR
jgi:hypothetical protein